MFQCNVHTELERVAGKEVEVMKARERERERERDRQTDRQTQRDREIFFFNGAVNC
jgi:hypothetical protein